jgi:hypothetical protein
MEEQNKIIVFGSRYKKGTSKWIKDIWEKNTHLTAGQKIYACLWEGIDYYKLLNTAIKYNLSLKDS